MYNVFLRVKNGPNLKFDYKNNKICTSGGPGLPSRRAPPLRGGGGGLRYGATIMSTIIWGLETMKLWTKDRFV